MASAQDADFSATDEVPFQVDELFFSRTNEAGIILSGNSVFQRVSHYSWDELIQKPHKIIRHPDMPRAVFWLLWDTIKRGEPIGAYVKNRAKDGRHYWVFAIVTPIEGGYLSVRLKPTSDLFSIVRQEYLSFVHAEGRDKIPPATGAQLLLARLGELGFANYSEFMATALSKEITARDEQLGRTPDDTIAFFNELVDAARTLLRHTGVISTAYEQNEHVPLNFQVQAAQLGQDGAAIGVVSNNYNIISVEIKKSMGRFIDSARQVFTKINDGLSLLCVAKMQREVLEFFRKENAADGHSQEQEMFLLDKQQKAYREKALDGLQRIAKEAENFRLGCAEMKRLAAGLEVTRIMGKVECSRLLVMKDGLNELLDDLETFQKTIAGGLKEIEQMNQRIHYNTDKLLRVAKAA